MASSSDPPRTLFVYTEEQRGNQLVESVLVGMISDIAGAEKLVVVKDPHSGIQFVYRVLHEISNLDAAAITELDPAEFDGRRTTQINGMNYRLGTPDSALKLLRGKTHWVQDKGCVLSVLLQNAAVRRSTLVSRSIARERLTRVPPGVPVEYLADRPPAQAEPAPDTTTPA